MNRKWEAFLCTFRSALLKSEGGGRERERYAKLSSENSLHTEYFTFFKNVSRDVFGGLNLLKQ